MKYFLYILRCGDGSLYCGQTKDLKRRLLEHQNGKSRAAKYVRAKGMLKLEYWEGCESLSDAMKKEYEFKQWPKQKKEDFLKRQSFVSLDSGFLQKQ